MQKKLVVTVTGRGRSTLDAGDREYGWEAADSIQNRPNLFWEWNWRANVAALMDWGILLILLLLAILWHNVQQHRCACQSSHDTLVLSLTVYLVKHFQVVWSFVDLGRWIMHIEWARPSTVWKYLVPATVQVNEAWGNGATTILYACCFDIGLHGTLVSGSICYLCTLQGLAVYQEAAKLP